MRTAKILFLALGVGLFAWLLTRVELGRVTREVMAVGLAGFALVLALYALEFLCDVVAWLLTVSGLPLSPVWTTRLYGIRLVGEAWNVVTPLGGMGGEPVKALLLKRRHAIPYTRSGASLVLAKTAAVISLLAFLAVGFAMMLHDPRIGAELRTLAGVGLAGLSAGIGGFFLVQRLGVTSRLGARLRVTRTLEALREFDHHLVAFYTREPLRFASVLVLGFANWMLGAAGVWVTLYFMGHPVSFLDAWIIEAMAQMVRAATFFIPASLGAQEGAIMVVVSAISGDAASGLAVALVRRGRELVWVGTGLALSVGYLGGLPRRDRLADPE